MASHQIYVFRTNRKSEVGRRIQPNIKCSTGSAPRRYTLYSLLQTYLNDSLLELETRALGKFIGTLYMGCPTVVYDVLFMASSDDGLQLMFNLAYINSQEKRYVIHPQKTTAQRRNVSKFDTQSEIVKDWFLGPQKVKVDSKLSHLGLTRTEKSENSINIAE